MQDINASIGYDKRLYRQDIAGSKAHASMLAATKIISDDDCHYSHRRASIGYRCRGSRGLSLQEKEKERKSFSRRDVIRRLRMER